MRRTPLATGAVVLVALTLADAPPPIRLVPALRLRTTVSVDGACPGADRVVVRAATSVTYCYSVTNTGSTPVRNVVIVNAGRSVRVGALAGGQSRTVTYTIVVTPAAGALAEAPGAGTASEQPATEGMAEAADIEVVAPVTTVTGDEGVPGVAVTDTEVGHDGQLAIGRPAVSPATAFAGSLTTPAAPVQSP
jgi:hypothetical protein